SPPSSGRADGSPGAGCPGRPSRLLPGRRHLGPQLLDQRLALAQELGQARQDHGRHRALARVVARHRPQTETELARCLGLIARPPQGGGCRLEHLLAHLTSPEIRGANTACCKISHSAAWTVSTSSGRPSKRSTRISVIARFTSSTLTGSAPNGVRAWRTPWF